MGLTDLLAPASRIIDVGATDPAVARALAAEGRTRYLGLVAPAVLATVRHQAGELAARFCPLTSMSQVVRNSTDLLILRRPFVRCLWSVPDLRHVRYVAVEVGPGTAAVEARLAETLGRLAGKTTALGRVTCGGTPFEVVEVVGHRPRPRARRYLSPVWGVAGLVERLEEAGLSYVVLRWFERLPALDPDEDLDILVADQDLDKVQYLLAEEPGTIPVDLYSETGLKAADYQGIAYYPPPLARRLLDRAVVHPSGCRVPAPMDHLRSLAYHAVYHKGARSGLPSTVLGTRYEHPEHDYPAVLADLAGDLGVDLPRTLEGVDEWLDGEGWRPSLDTLLRLTASNPWIPARFFPEEQVAVEPPEPAVFLVRERTARVVPPEEFLGLLDHLGFEVLVTRELDGAARERCAAETRGGNWGRGPFEVSGGGPATVVVAVHYAPLPPGPRLRRRYPRLTNADVLLAKGRVRDLVNARLEPAQRFNPVHSSDSEVEAWEYVKLALPDEVERLRAEVARRRAAYRTDAPVVAVLSRGRRAKVEVVEGGDGTVVRKTFAPGYLGHMERELQGLRELGPHVAAVPRLVETGPNWFTCPYYRDELTGVWSRGRLVPLPVVRAMVAALRAVHARGYDLVDAKPQNFLLDPGQGLKLIDFEFLHRYLGAAPAFAESYGFVGVPEGFAGNAPVSEWNYDYRWRRWTGLSHETLLTGTPWQQHRERAVHLLRRAATGPQAPARRAARVARRQLRRTRRQASRQYGQWARRRAGGAFRSVG